MNVWGGQKFLPDVVRLVPAESGFFPTKSVIQELQDESTKWCTLIASVVEATMRRDAIEGRRPRGGSSQKKGTIPFPSQQPFATLLLICPPSAIIAQNLDTRRDLFPATPHVSCNVKVKACAEEGMGRERGHGSLHGELTLQIMFDEAAHVVRWGISAGHPAHDSWIWLLPKEMNYSRATKRTYKVMHIARVVGVSMRWGSIESECLFPKDRSTALPLPSRLLRPFFFFFFVVYLCNWTKFKQSRGSLSILCRMCRGNQRWRHVRAFITMGSSCRPDRWKPYVTNGWGEQDFRPVIPLMPAETGFHPGKWVIQELQDEIHTMLQFAILGKVMMRRGSTEGIRHSVAVFKRQEQCPSLLSPLRSASSPSPSSLSSSRKCTKFGRSRGFVAHWPG